MDGMNGTAVAILIGVWATFALDVFSTLNSSPQTTELFAGDRQESLMHWVAIGAAAAVAGGAVGSTVSGRVWPLAVTIAVALGMYGLYGYAVKRGTGTAPPAAAA